MSSDGQVNESIQQYFDDISSTLATVDVSQLEKLVCLMLDAYGQEKTIFVFGNGGSAATASHMANDLSKGAGPHGGVGLRVVSLVDCVPIITAWANDVSYDEIFVAQLRGLMVEGDVVIGISGSGNSENVIRAIEYANANRGITVGFSGRDGGRLKQLCNLSVHVPNMIMEQIKDVHLIIEHMLVSVVRRQLELCYHRQTT